MGFLYHKFCVLDRNQSCRSDVVGNFEIVQSGMAATRYKGCRGADSVLTDGRFANAVHSHRSPLALVLLGVAVRLGSRYLSKYTISTDLGSKCGIHIFVMQYPVRLYLSLARFGSNTG